jgi:hypothetical protein
VRAVRLLEVGRSEKACRQLSPRASEAVADGDPGSVRDQLRRLETRKREINADLKAQQGDREIAIHLPDLYRRKVARLQEVLKDEAARPQAVENIRSLLDRIEVHPGRERGQCEVMIVGALAQILAFAQQKTTAASTGDSGTFLMVAGACNHRELTLPPIPV